MRTTKKAIIFDGKKWYVRRIRVIEHDMNRDEKVYRCDRAVSNDHKSLSEVPEVKELLKLCVDFHRPHQEVMETALRESVSLQTHYAKLLNDFDGGARMTFDSPEQWIARLRKTGTIA